MYLSTFVVFWQPLMSCVISTQIDPYVWKSRVHESYRSSEASSSFLSRIRYGFCLQHKVSVTFWSRGGSIDPIYWLFIFFFKANPIQALWIEFKFALSFSNSPSSFVVLLISFQGASLAFFLMPHIEITTAYLPV